MRRTLLVALVLSASLIVSGCLHAPMPWSPDGKWIAYTVEVRPTGDLVRPGWLFDSPTNGPSFQLAGPSRPVGYRLWASRADSGESVLLEDSRYPLTAPGWSPDGRALAFGRVVEVDDAAKFEIVVLDGPGRRRVLSSRTIGVMNGDAARLPGQAIAWSPDGRHLAIPQLNPLGMAIIRADNGRVVNTIIDAFLPSWSPDGSRLAFFLRGTGDTLNCLDSPSGQPRMLAELGQASQAVAWTRDSQTVITTARRPGPRGAGPPGDLIEILKVRADTGQIETIPALSSDELIGRDRVVEGVSLAFDQDGDNLFCSTVVENRPNQITWYRPRERAVYKKFFILDYSSPMGSLSLSPDGRTLATRLGSIERLSPPALCDLESPELRSRLLAPDDSSRVEWIALLVNSARGILASLPMESTEPGGKSSGRLQRPTLLPVAGEFESNTEPAHRLRRIGRLGRPLCDRPASAASPTAEVAALLDEARFFFDYLSESYSAAMNSLEVLESQAETSDRRLRLLMLRAQLFLARGDVDHGDETIRYLETLERKPARRIEWAGSGYLITGVEPTAGRGWPSYLAWKSAALRSKLDDEVEENHVNIDAPRFNFGLGPIEPRGNPLFPNDPFLLNPNDRPMQPNRNPPSLKPRIQFRDPRDNLPRL